jgi:serine/threonine protein kinase
MQVDDPTLPLSPRRRDFVATQQVAGPECAPPALRRGEMLGRYLILREIGRGGMGIVFAAYDPELDRKVALKLLYPDRNARDGRAGQHRLLREAQALARLSHPNIIHVYDAGIVGGRVFMTMELVQGETLEKWLSREAASWRQILAVFQAAGQGLTAAHAVGLVHRDFKPANVLLSEDGRVRVLDFGIARPVADAPFEPSGKADTVLGTPRYMAPEVIRGGRFDHRADQFSFCVALFESFYQTPPFAGENLEDLLRETSAGRVREASGARVPSRVRRLLLRGLDADPERRHPSIKALLEDLGRTLPQRIGAWLAGRF